MSSGSRGDVTGRIIGMLVFLIGVALLLVVFYVAFDLFTASPDKALGIRPITGNSKTDPAAMNIAVRFAWLLFRIASLAIMSIAGSLVANKGINLYFSAIQHAQGAPPKATVSPPV